MGMQSSRLRIWRRWRATRALAVLGAGVLVATLVSPAGAVDRRPPMGPNAAKASVNGTYIYATATANSSKGKKLVARLSASHASYGDRMTFSVGLPSGDESHQWSFDPDAGGYDVNGDGKGKLTMDIGDTAGFAKLKVSVTPTGKFKRYKCGGKVSSKYRPIKVKGVYFVDSKSSKWGHVGSESKKTFVLKGTFSKYYNVSCPDSGGNTPCYTALYWSASQYDMTSSVTIGGTLSGKKAYAYGYRSFDIAGSNDGSGFDSVNDPKTAKPVLKVKPDDNATLDVWAGPGSAVLSSNYPKSTSKSDCGKNKTQVRDSWSGKVANGAKPLKLAMQAAAALTISDDQNAYFSKSSVKD